MRLLEEISMITIDNRLMHKRAGISRNRTAALKEAKLSHQRKKFRFQSLHEDEESICYFSKSP